MRETAADPSLLAGSVWPVTQGGAGEIYAVGASIFTGRPTSWYPPNWRGWLPVQCYLLRDRGESLLLDTGLRIHEPIVRAALQQLFSEQRTRTLMMTRRELDTILNLPWIVRDFGIQAVYAVGEQNPLAFFDAMDEESASAHIAATSPVEVTIVRPGTVVRVGGLSLQAVRTSLRVLATHWFYEPETRTLFSSDSWAFLSRPQPTGPFCDDGAGGMLSAEEIKQYLEVKFDWLRGIDTRPIIEDLKGVFSQRHVDRICPSSGGIIVGRGAVEHVLTETVRALELLAKTPRQSALSGFTYP